MAKQQITIPVFVPHLGCRHQCIFCNQRAATGSHSPPEPHDIDSLVRTYLSKRKAGIRRIEIAFFGGSFTGIESAKQKAYLAAAKRHCDEGSIHGIRCSTRPDCISRETLDLLAEYGVTTIELGVQSLDDSVLSAAHRGHDASDVFKAVDLIRDYGFEFVLQLMPGLPGESRESAINTAEVASHLGPSAARIYPAVVLKGTRMEKLYIDGTYRPMTIDEAIELCKDIYIIFLNRGIPVIRMGLHPFSPDEVHTVIAGPYHPSFGALVRSRARRDEMAASINGHIASSGRGLDGLLHIAIPDGHAAEYIGEKRQNMRYLERLFNYRRVMYTVERRSDMRVVSC